MASLKTYDPSQVIVSIGAHVVGGFADGEKVTVERDEDAYSLNIGTDGDGARAKSSNFAGKITIRLQQTSDSNDVLLAYANADEINNGGLFPILVADRSGRSLHAAETAWVQKKPNAPYAREVGVREWVIRTDRLRHLPSGN